MHSYSGAYRFCGEPYLCEGGGGGGSSGPDLAISASSISGSLTPGSVLSFSGTVRNQGDEEAGATSQTRFRLDIGNNGSWDVNPANKSTGHLDAGDTEAETWSNAWTAQVGTHKYEICADINDSVDESDEDDNCTSETFTVGCTALTYRPATSGFSTSATGPVASTLTVSPGQTFYAFVDYGMVHGGVQAPNVGGGYTCNWDNYWLGTAGRFLCAAPSSAGSYTYTTGLNAIDPYCAAGPDTVGSTNGLTVSSPDIISADLYINSAGPKVGDIISFFGQVKNQGTGSAGASNARFCLDPAGGAGPCLAGTAGRIGTTDPAVPALPPGSYGNGIFSPNAAWTATIGDHTFYLCADVYAVVSESNEANNCTAYNFTVVNQVPTTPSVTVTEPDYCATGPAAYVNWTYSDPDGDPQSAYQVQIDEQGSFGSPEVDSGKVFNGGTSYFAGSGLSFDITYRARVRVWDSHDSVSNWTESDSWKTPKHACPYVDFTYAPSTDIPAKQPIQFTDQTIFYDDGGGARTWSWLFGDSGASNQQNPSHTYDLPGLYDVTLTVTDKDGFTCSRSKQINIAQPIPVWKEVGPR